MANGNGNGKAQTTFNIVLPIGALALLATIVMTVHKDAGIALDVARQHGQELLLLRGEINILKEEILDRTRLRYTSKDAEKDHANHLYRIQALERRVDQLEKHPREDHANK